MTPARNPFAVEIVRNALIKCAEDMRATMQRTAYSPVIYEGVDLACAIVRTDGSMLAETSGIPAFLGNVVNAVRVIHSTIKDVQPEDVYFLNDPYCGGGTHANDVVTAYPIFFEGQLLAYAVIKAHMLDCGGMHTGGWYSSTTEIFQEGLRVPPVRLYTRGEPNEDIYSILRLNSRMPEAMGGDIRSMVGAVRTGGARVVEVIERFGLDEFERSVNEVLDHAERITRAEILRIPDGEYEAEFWLDGDGDQLVTLSDGLKAHVRITIAGDEMVVDLSGSSDQSIGPMNSAAPNSVSFVRYGLKSLTTPELPNNEGCFRPLTVVLRPGSIFDPLPPAACACWADASQSIPDLMMRAMAPAMPDRVRASTFGSDIAQFTYGIDPVSRKNYLYVEESVPGGYGAKPFEDGESALHAPIEGDTSNIPVEMVEVSYPIRVLEYALVPDSGGAGKWRGGLGAIKRITPLNHDCRMTAVFDRTEKDVPWGLFGGGAGAQNQLSILRRDGSLETNSKVTAQLIHEGDTVTFRSGGGGGYGDALTRDVNAVLDDVIDGYVTPQAAEREYGVVIVSHADGSFGVDAEATGRRRENV